MLSVGTTFRNSIFLTRVQLTIIKKTLPTVHFPKPYAKKTDAPPPTMKARDLVVGEAYTCHHRQYTPSSLPMRDAFLNVYKMCPGTRMSTVK